MHCLSHLSVLAFMSPALSRIDYNADCKRALLNRGLVKRFQDDFGNLLLEEFSSYMFGVQLENQETPEIGLVPIYPALACLPQGILLKLLTDFFN
jgi:hypothetical protein